MLQQVVLNGETPYTLDIDAVDSDDLIIIKSISGLDPADLTLFTGDYSRDGGYYQGRRLGGRNPVFNLKLNPDYVNDIEISDVREMLYEMFYEPQAGSDELQVVLKDDRRPDRYFIGATEKMPADIFSKSTDAQISMVCVDGYLRSVTAVNDSDAVGWTTLPVSYEGTAKTGLEMELKIKTATSVATVDIGGVTMTLTGTFAVDDIIVINTSYGERKITLNGVDAMVLLTSGPEWVQLRRGTNTIKTYGSVEGDAKVSLMEYTYRAAWWGI